ncbi:hypothetical protein NL676_010675 [Syzygium grande]|nr:hypothetical protein NL676_010675 [Syzygium grande]
MEGGPRHSYCTTALPTTAAATPTTSRTPPHPSSHWVQELAQSPVFITRNPELSHSSCILEVPCGSDVFPSLRSFRIWRALAQAARVGPSPKAARATAKILAES